MLFDIWLPSFDTILHNISVTVLRSWHLYSSYNAIVGYPARLKSIWLAVTVTFILLVCQEYLIGCYGYIYPARLKSIWLAVTVTFILLVCQEYLIGCYGYILML